MGQSDIVKAENENVNPFSFDFGSEFIKENLPAEKRTELAVVAQSRRHAVRGRGFPLLRRDGRIRRPRERGRRRWRLG